MKNHEDPTLPPPGVVALVGAGPGDPELLTVAALKAIKHADVVVYDALVSPEVLEQIPKKCQQIFAGKRGGRPSVSQADICATLVELARQGKRVVRLKGGDPFVFGRGGEEALLLAREGIPFRIVPGLTSGIAGPAYAGIPVTHRAVNAGVALITGHEAAEGDKGESESRVDWEAVARAFPVIVLYMAIRNLPETTRRLMAAGRDPGTPAAVIRWATTARQETLLTTLGNLVRDVTRTGMESPSIVVIGEVAKLREELAWFADKTVVAPPE